MSNSTELCPYCKERTLVTQLCGKKSPHYAETVCALCSHHVRFVPKPDNLKKRPSNKRLRKEINYCELCLRDGLRLQEHHVLPVKTNPEYDKEKSNRWVLCESCHNMVHKIRSYCGTGENNG